jgi:hypothetical protein
MSRVSLLAEVIRLKAGSQGSGLSRKAVWLAGLLAVLTLLLPARAVARPEDPLVVSGGDCQIVCVNGGGHLVWFSWW